MDGGSMFWCYSKLTTSATWKKLGSNVALQSKMYEKVLWCGYTYLKGFFLRHALQSHALRSCCFIRGPRNLSPSSSIDSSEGKSRTIWIWRTNPMDPMGFEGQKCTKNTPDRFTVKSSEARWHTEGPSQRGSRIRSVSPWHLRQLFRMVRLGMVGALLWVLDKNTTPKTIMIDVFLG